MRCGVTTRISMPRSSSPQPERGSAAEPIPLFDRARPSLRPDLRAAKAARAGSLKAGRRPPPEAARSVLCVGHVRQFWGCKSPVQPDGGEALAKRKGRTARDCLKEAWSKVATRRTETGYEAALVGRAGRMSQSPYPSRARTAGNGPVLREIIL